MLLCVIFVTAVAVIFTGQPLATILVFGDQPWKDLISGDWQVELLDQTDYTWTL